MKTGLFTAFSALGNIGLALILWKVANSAQLPI